MTSIGWDAFNGCSGLKDVYCYAVKVPDTDVGDETPIRQATLHVPAASIEGIQVNIPLEQIWAYRGNRGVN